LRHEVKQHANSQNPNDDSEHDPHANLFFTKSVPHVRKPSRATLSGYSAIQESRQPAHTLAKQVIINESSTYTQSLILLDCAFRWELALPTLAKTAGMRRPVNFFDFLSNFEYRTPPKCRISVPRRDNLVAHFGDCQMSNQLHPSAEGKSLIRVRPRGF